MSDNRKIFQNPGSGFFGNLVRHIKLVWLLLQDERVPFWLKLIPFSTLLYLVFPLDIPGPIDDAAVIWLGSYMFLEMCPPDVVDELRLQIEGTVTVESRDPEENEKEIIDVEFTIKNSQNNSEDNE